MKVEITIDCDNAAFEDEPAREVGRILTKLATRITKIGLSNMPNGILDINGNTTGKFLFTED